jgi:CheY-like chemotaxis protein
MSKKILILETSVTLQKLFTTTLDSDDYQVQFVNDGKAAIYTLLEYQPDLFLVNCDIREPRSFEIVRLVRSISSFKELTIGMYASFPTPLDETFALSSGATSFVRLDQKTLVLNVDELAQLPVHKIDKLSLGQIKKNFDDSYLFNNATELLFRDSYKTAMFSKIVSLIDSLESVEEKLKTIEEKKGKKTK